MTHLEHELKSKILDLYEDGRYTQKELANLKKSVQKAMRKIPTKSYLNYMKYAYKNKDIRKFIEKPSTRRKTLKNYKL